MTAPGDGTVRILDAAPGVTELVTNRPERFNALQSGLPAALTADHREAVQAFLAKRPPRFTGR